MKTIIFLMFILDACAGPQIPIADHKLCNVAGIFQAGLDCATDETSAISTMNFQQMVNFLEPQDERPDPDHPGQTLPARAGAIIISDIDFTDLKTALEQACVELKDRCTPTMQEALANAGSARKRINAFARKKKRH